MDPLKEIFDSYDPVLSPADDFMARLDARLDAVESAKASHQEELERLHAHMNALKRRLNVATIAAFIVGFLSGAVCAMFTPMATDFLSKLILTDIYFHIPDFSGSLLLPPVLQTVPWLLTAAISVFAAMKTYETVMARPVSDR